MTPCAVALIRLSSTCSSLAHQELPKARSCTLSSFGPGQHEAGHTQRRWGESGELGSVSV